MDPRSRLLARIAGVAAAAHALGFIALHFLEPELRVSSSIISDYGATDSAWLATLAFLLFGAVWAALAFALSGSVASSRALSAARGLFLLAAVSIFATAVFPEHADPRTGSLFSTVQNILTRPGLFLGILLTSLGLRSEPRWREVGLVLVLISTACIIVLLATVGLLLEAGLGGYGQRLIFVLVYLWVFLLTRPMMGVWPSLG